MRSAPRPLPGVVALLALVLATGAWAQSSSRQPSPPEPEPAPAPAQGSRLPDSVRRVEQQTGGEVLRAEPMRRDGREVYRLKVLTSDGRVRVMQDDPQQRGSDSSEDNPRRDSQRPDSRRRPARGSSGQGDQPPPES